jgi:hypothetical protein
MDRGTGHALAVSHIGRREWSMAADHALMSGTLSAVVPSTLTKSTPQDAKRATIES